MNIKVQSPIIIPVSKVSQPIGDFYVGSIDAKSLCAITYTEIRQFIEGTQDRIAGIQRERSERRINEIKKYVNLDYATFPTSVIISVDADCVELEPLNCSTSSNEQQIFSLKLLPFGSLGDDKYIPMEKIAFIIDGQHRVAGLEGLLPDRRFDVNISVFVGASDADKAEIFARVNQSQTKVNKSLVIDLASYYEERGPVKFAHEVVLALNSDKDGPLNSKVKRLGKADPGMGRVQTLAQATVVEPIVNYIASDPEQERNRRYRGLFGSRREPEAWKKFIFQPFYDRDDDSGLFLCLSNYFSAVKQRWPDYWDNAPSGSILNRTTGYVALMRFLKQVYIRHCDKGEILSEDIAREVFSKINIEGGDFNRENFIPGSSGISALYRRLMSEMEWGD